MFKLRGWEDQKIHTFVWLMKPPKSIDLESRNINNQVLLDLWSPFNWGSQAWGLNRIKKPLSWAHLFLCLAVCAGFRGGSGTHPLDVGDGADGAGVLEVVGEHDDEVVGDAGHPLQLHVCLYQVGQSLCPLHPLLQQPVLTAHPNQAWQSLQTLKKKEFLVQLHW